MSRPALGPHGIAELKLQLFSADPDDLPADLASKQGSGGINLQPFIDSPFNDIEIQGAAGLQSLPGLSRRLLPIGNQKEDRVLRRR